MALRGVNEDEFADLIAWAHGRGMDLTLIEVMPLGDIGDGRSTNTFRYRFCGAPLAALHSRGDRLPTGGPARYVRVAETGGRLGFITPLTHNFCELQSRAA